MKNNEKSLSFLTEPDETPATRTEPYTEDELEYMPPYFTPAPPGPAAHALACVGRYFAPDITAREMADMLTLSIECGDSGAKALHKQAQVLDGLFHRLTVQALDGPEKNSVHAGMMEFALRAQKQCNASFYVAKMLEKIQKNDEQTK